MKNKLPGGMVLWEGPSRIDRKPIVLIATSIRPKGRNANQKTGDLVMTWIMRRDLSIYEQLRTGADRSVCGDCRLRGDGTGKQRSCYVHMPMVNNIWEGYRAGAYPYLDRPMAEILAGRQIRLGSFGDPAVVPWMVWREVLEAARGAIGYTHQWRRCDPKLQEFVMASVDNPSEQQLAQAAGWRTFRTRLPEEPLLEREIACPASQEAGKRTTCLECMLCDGRQYSPDRRANLAIISHGWSTATSSYRRMRERESLRVLA